jgi:hypothetical protein
MTFSGREFSETLDMVPGPVFVDECNHGSDCYIGTIKVETFYNKAFKEELYDIYVFNDAYSGQEVCMRFGNEPHEYISPGPLIQFLQIAICHRQNMPHYAFAADLLFHEGQISYERNF